MEPRQEWEIWLNLTNGSTSASEREYFIGNWGGLDSISWPFKSFSAGKWLGDALSLARSLARTHLCSIIGHGHPISIPMHASDYPSLACFSPPFPFSKQNTRTLSTYRIKEKQILHGYPKSISNQPSCFLCSRDPDLRLLHYFKHIIVMPHYKFNIISFANLIALNHHNFH